MSVPHHFRIVAQSDGPFRIEQEPMWGLGPDGSLCLKSVAGTESYGCRPDLPKDTNLDDYFKSMEMSHRDRLYQEDLETLRATAQIVFQAYQRECKRTGSVRPRLNTVNISLTSFTNPNLAKDILNIFGPYKCNILAIEITEDRTGITSKEYTVVKKNAQQLNEKGCIVLLDDLSPHDPRLVHLAGIVSGAKTDHRLTQKILRNGSSVFSPKETSFLEKLCTQGGIIIPEGTDTEGNASKLVKLFSGANTFFQGHGISVDRRKTMGDLESTNRFRSSDLNAFL